MSVKLFFGGVDDTPDAFSFTAQTGKERSTSYVSNTVTITGISGSIPVSIVSGTGDFSINGGGYVTSGFILNNQTLTLRTTSSSAFSTAVSFQVKVGMVNGGTFSVTTRAADNTPVGYGGGYFQTGAELYTYYGSTNYTISGLEPNYPVSVSVSGGTAYGASVAAGTYPTITTAQFSAATNITADASGRIVIRPQCRSPGNFDADEYFNVYIGSGVGSYYIQTRGADLTPDAFSFTAQTGKERNTYYDSNSITVTGLEPNQSIYCYASGNDKICIQGTWTWGGTFTTNASGQLTGVQARCLTPNVASWPGSTVTTYCYIGNSAAIPFSVTTRSPLVPSGLGNFDYYNESHNWDGQTGLDLGGTYTTWVKYFDLDKNTFYSAGMFNHAASLTGSYGHIGGISGADISFTGNSPAFNSAGTASATGAGGGTQTTWAWASNKASSAPLTQTFSNLGYPYGGGSMSYFRITTKASWTALNFNGNISAESVGSNAIGSLVFYADGSINWSAISDSTGTIVSGSWASGSGMSAAWINVSSTALITGTTLNGWYQMNQTRSWTLTRATSGASTGNVVISVAASSGGTVLSSGIIYFDSTRT